MPIKLLLFPPPLRIFKPSYGPEVYALCLIKMIMPAHSCTIYNQGENHVDHRDVVPGGAGGAMTPPDFGRSVNPISTRGTDYAHLTTAGTPGFSDLPTALDHNW